ncbi:MAG: hypothetical protein OEM62_09255, partial [Acidobacteriota bacterium]|nr:hypothetical protein [Acidobacteriota bacterium]
MSETAKSISFHIDGLDCAEEVILLKRALAPIVGSEDRLAFDVLSAKMSVRAPMSTGETARIIEAVSQTGLTARPWRTAKEASDGTQGLWETNGRTALCGISGVLLTP